VLSGARRFTELGISANKPLTDPEQIEQGVRRLAEENSGD
jgi:hypothetical protein